MDANVFQYELGCIIHTSNQMELKVHHCQYTIPFPAHTTTLVPIPSLPIMLIQKSISLYRFKTQLTGAWVTWTVLPFRFTKWRRTLKRQNSSLRQKLECSHATKDGNDARSIRLRTWSVVGCVVQPPFS